MTQKSEIRHVTTIIAFLFLASIASASSAAVFQFATPVETKKGKRMAYLWIPPRAQQVRGVVVGGMTLMEREMARDGRIRAACAEADLAILFFNTGLKSVDLPAVLTELADVSGYEEIDVAPLMFVGHSAGGPQARAAAVQFADRCFGLVQYRGADPGDVDHDGKDGLPPGIPAMMMIGQFDEFGKIGRDAAGIENWEKDRDKLARWRAKNVNHLGSIAVEPGGGHFAWSDRNAELLALFIPRAAKARIPERWPIDAAEPIELQKVDPKSGWLTSLDLKLPVKVPPARYKEFTGERANAAWHFDEALAKAFVDFHRPLTKADQFIRWQDPHKVQAGARNFFEEIQWVGDGQTFEVHPAYRTTVPTIRGSLGNKWGRAGEEVGHADVPIQVKAVSGPVVAARGHRLRFEFNELAPATAKARISFMAFSVGDDTYRYTEHVGLLSSELACISEGEANQITFQPLVNITPKSPPLQLNATSSAGLPVDFHIGYGPAKIDDGKLVIADLPARARYPITVQVVAYQFGRGVKPQVQTADPVVRTFKINRRDEVAGEAGI